MFHPLVPLARALVGDGHEVAFATGEGFCPWVQQVGFAAFPAGLHRDAYIDELKRLHPWYPASIPREELLRFHLTTECARFGAPAKVTDLLGIIDDWQPQLVVHEMTDFAAPVAASVAGIPYVSHSLSPFFPLELWSQAAEALAPLWSRWGVEPGPLGGLFRHLYLDIVPPTLEDPDVGQLPLVLPIRPVVVHLPLDDDPPDAAPSWLDELAPQPTVYVTLGTIFNKNPALFATILEALGGEPLNLVVAVGSDVDPAELGHQPAHVHLVRYVPQALVLERCDAVVCHGGAGAVLAAAVHGLPVLVLPQGVDQFVNARRCAAAGVARWLPPEETSPESVRREARRLLDDPGHRAAAFQLRREVEAMPEPASAVGALEQLVGRGAVGAPVR